VNTKKCGNIKIYLVFIGVFNFLWGILELTHAFSHYSLPFLDFFGQVMHFYKSLWAILIDTYCKSLQMFSFVVVYWQALKNA
jgi:hypothetical protein